MRFPRRVSYLSFGNNRISLASGGLVLHSVDEDLWVAYCWEQKVKSNKITVLQERTDAKLRYADEILKELGYLARQKGNDFDRAHQEAFLFHLLGAFDSFLAEINRYYDCNFPEDSLSANRLRKKITEMTGDTSPELRELYELGSTPGSWLNSARSMRDHSTHQRGVSRHILLSGPVRLQVPSTGEILEQDFPDLFSEWHHLARDLIEKLRSQAISQMK
jgi:hypothetical protein